MFMAYSSMNKVIFRLLYLLENALCMWVWIDSKWAYLISLYSHEISMSSLWDIFPQKEKKKTQNKLFCQKVCMAQYEAAQFVC